MKGILGLKVGMTQIFDEDGSVSPVTIIQAGPCFVTQVKNMNKDGYSAIQVGFGDVRKVEDLSKGEQGHLGLLPTDGKHPQRKKNKNIPAVRHIREFKTKTAGDYHVGQQLTVAQFEVGERVDVSGISKGKGFAGVVKRHGFAGGPKTHGQSDRQRAPGSIGTTSGVARVFKGQRMGGRMGNDKKTAENLKVVSIDSEKNLIAVLGSVPGRKGGLVTIKDTAKDGGN